MKDYLKSFDFWVIISLLGGGLQLHLGRIEVAFYCLAGIAIIVLLGICSWVKLIAYALGRGNDN